VVVVRLGVQRVALLESLPERSVAHNDGVDDPKFVEGKLVLADAEALGRVTEPLVGSSSPVRILIKVDLPATLGPVMTYRLPDMKVVVTSSNKTRVPKGMGTLLIESII
jgi:hypothetical protein